MKISKIINLIVLSSLTARSLLFYLIASMPALIAALTIAGYQRSRLLLARLITR